MATIISALVTIFGIMAFGAITQRRGLFPASMGQCLNQFVYWVSLPCLLFTQMCTIPMDTNTGALFWGGLAASFIGYGLFYALFSLGFRHNGPESTLRTLSCCFPNAAFYGLPFILMVFPGSTDALNANMICALLCTGVSITADISLELLRHAREAGPDAPRLSRAATFRRIGRELAHNPMLIASFAGLCLSVGDVRPPEPLLRMTSMLGSTCAPCALFSLGMALALHMSGSFGPFSLKKSLVPLVLVSLGRLLLFPLLAFFVMRWAGCSGDMLAAATVTCAMPVAVMVYIFAERGKAGQAEVSASVVSSTLLSLITLPLVMLTLQYFKFC